MKGILRSLVGVALAIVVATTPARSDDRAVVEAFYLQLLSGATAADVPARAATILAPSWESIGDFSGKNKSRDAFIGQLQGFGKLMPDLKWAPQEIVQQGKVFVVRSRATGTPNGPLFGVPASGKTFDVMTIDMHTVENGMIVRSYHVEDWAGAIRQLSAK